MSASATAADPQSIVVAEPTLDGEWPGLSSADAAAAIAAGLDGEGLSVSTDDGFSCESAQCWSDRAGDLGVPYILHATVSVLDRDATVRLEVYGASGGALLASGESSCEVCADNEVREILTSAAALLRPRVLALGERQTPVVIETTPTGAQVIVDGEVVGTSPYRGTLEPGARGIVITAPGYLPRQLERFAEPGQTQVLDVVLEERVDARPPAVLYAGIGSLGAGVGLLAAGAVFVAVDGKPVGSTCDNGGRDLNGRCPRMYDTRLGGIAMLSIGASAVIAGTVLTIIGRKRGRSKSSDPRSAAVRRLGFQGRF
ncbi:MAG: PEGA domain-containing protein [Nannocystaceae bacterium]|nr:PEGA domain-containing protein [bacterium]